MFFGNKLLFLGCLYSTKLKEIGKKYVDLFSDNGYISIPEEEPCCGAPSLAYGKETTKNHLVAFFKKHSVKEIISPCPACAYYLKIQGFNAKPAIEEIYKLWKKKKIKINLPEKKYAFHDPCFLTRKFSFYEEIREMLNGKNFNDIFPNKEYTYCCGAGGTFRAFHEKESKEVGEFKKMQYESIDVIITQCPMCYIQLKETTGKEVLDFIEIIDF